MYNFDANAILVHPIPNRSAASLIEARNACHHRLTNNGHTYNLHVLDNEISRAFINVLEEDNIKYQLAPPGNHRTIAAERGICTFKDHFIAGLATCHPDYSIRE